MNTQTSLPTTNINCQQIIVWDRTKAMPLNRAFGFRNCLAKNRKMMFARVVHPHSVNGVLYAHVEWMTSSIKMLTARYDKVQAERLKRASDQFNSMEFVPVENTNTFQCTRTTEKGEVHEYFVSENDCGCRDYLVRCFNKNKLCKHSVALRQILGTINIDELSALLVKQEEVCHV